ncbi:MAG TPA: hypothetical protein VM783_17945 [Candidatus Acidoferrum sp.]|nr:hypothetical protein [Candidatus Acidoferrum sp.]
MIEQITKEQYMRALHHAREGMPNWIWGIDGKPGGEAYNIAGTSVYFCIAHVSNRHFEINGAFRVYIGKDTAKSSDAAAQIVQHCEHLGARRITLSAFNGAHKAWENVHFKTIRRVPFELHQAPVRWKIGYGTPDVHYMELEV